METGDLDERNLERFCQPPRAMSENVQIIVITHNKISMENMSQLIGVTMQVCWQCCRSIIENMSRLIGVTMREAGVSRQVSINLEEADSLISA